MKCKTVYLKGSDDDEYVNIEILKGSIIKQLTFQGFFTKEKHINVYLFRDSVTDHVRFNSSYLKHNIIWSDYLYESSDSIGIITGVVIINDINIPSGNITLYAELEENEDIDLVLTVWFE